MGVCSSLEKSGWIFLDLPKPLLYTDGIMIYKFSRDEDLIN